MIWTSYCAMIQILSEELPLHGLTEADVRVTQDVLAMVVKEYGPAASFVCDALNEYTTSKQDEIYADVVAKRAQHDDVATAAMAAGLSVVSAMHAYAAVLILKDVLAERDEPSIPDDGSDDAYRRWLAENGEPAFLKSQAT